MNDLTDTEKWDYINIQITKDYPKLAADAKRITSYNHQQFEDLLPFCLEQLLTKKPLDYIYKLVVLDKALPNWMGRSMSLNLRSSTSPYWNSYRKEMYNHRGVYLAETEDAYLKGHYDEVVIEAEMDNFECMVKSLSQLDFYHQAIITDYYLKQLTYQQLHKKYGISLRHLKEAIDNGLELLRQNCKEFISK